MAIRHMLYRCAVCWVICGGFFVCCSVLMAQAAPSQAVCNQIYQQYGVFAVGCDSLAQTAARPDVTSQRADGGMSDKNIESHVFFPTGGSALDAAARAQIAKIAQVLETSVMGGACVRLVGHSDTVGNAERNQTLSEVRAQRVADMLMPLLSDPTRILQVTGQGEKAPLPGLSPTAVENRRVAIWARSCDRPIRVMSDVRQ